MKGEARVGKKGSEYTDPFKYIPEEVVHLVADRIMVSTKRQPTIKLAESCKT